MLFSINRVEKNWSVLLNGSVADDLMILLHKKERECTSRLMRAEKSFMIEGQPGVYKESLLVCQISQLTI